MKTSVVSGLVCLAIGCSTAALAGEAPFEGLSSPLPGWAPGAYRGDYFKHKNEKPLFSITAANVDKHAGQLTPGQIALFKQKPDYRMDVYPTHRVCGLPEWIKANTKRNEGQARLDASGNNLENAVLPGVPFPNPRNGAEAMWNFLVHYKGTGLKITKGYTSVSPRAPGGGWIDAIASVYYFQPWGARGTANTVDVNGVNFGTYFDYVSPVSLAGQALVSRQYFGKPMETHYYFAGQRRVRRLPTYDHDAPLIGYENAYLQDESGLFNGSIDRFDFQIVGKEQRIVPYNAFRMQDFRQPYHEAVREDSIAPENRRYELHEVLHIRGTLRPDMRHVVSRKDVYLDLDSWLYLVGEDYDAQGRLWKVREGYPMPIWELEGACDVTPMAQYDLATNRYVFDNSALGSGTDIQYVAEPNGDIHFTPGFYTPESLRMVSER